MKVTIEFDTEKDSYGAIDRVVREAFGLNPDLFGSKARPMADGEIWLDPEHTYDGPWTEQEVRRWVRELPEVPDVVQIVHHLCGVPDRWTDSSAVGAALFPQEKTPGHRVGAAIRRAVLAGRKVDRRSWPFERDRKGGSTRVPSVIAPIVLEELQHHPSYVQALAGAAQQPTA
ncbi:hypothetical protein ACWCYY_34855 [Kitasatospora sp. NPDC001664]